MTTAAPPVQPRPPLTGRSRAEWATPRRLLVTLALAGTVILPSLARAFGGTSMAAGSLIVSLGWILLLSGFLVCGEPIGRLGRVVWLSLLALTVVLTSSAVSLLVNGEAFNAERFFQTYVYLICFGTGAVSFAVLAATVRSADVRCAICVTFMLLLIAAAAGLANVSPFFQNDPSVLFFTENSHFALAISPFLLYMTVAARRVKWFYPALGMTIAILLQSLTLFVASLVIALMACRVRQILVIILVTAPIVLIGLSQSGTGYYQGRIAFSAANANLSGLTYMNGWERVYLNLRDFRGAGVGFQQLGFVGTEGDMAQLLASLNNPGLSRLDGSFVAAKLISELGIVGIVALLFYLRSFARTAASLRNFEQCRTRSDQQIFFDCCFLMYAIDLFVRGTGYFSGTGFIFLAALMWRLLAATEVGESSPRHPGPAEWTG